MLEEDVRNEIFTDKEISSKQREIRYFRPKFYHRVFANFIDIFIFAIIFIGLFSLSRLIASNVPDYQAKVNELETIRIESGLYVRNDKNELKDIVSYINNDNSNTAGSRVKKAKRAIETFFTYSETKMNSEDYQIVLKDYDDFRLDEKLTYDNKPLFVKDENDEIIENPELVEGASNLSPIFQQYYKLAYAKFIDDHLQGYLVTSIPHYYDLTKYMFNVLVFGEVLVSYAVTGILVYFVPTIIFSRGRKTLGKALYQIGTVDQNLLSPSFLRNLARFSIFYFAELLLSLATFGIPYIISFTMMAFSKSKTGFPDFMLKNNEVDGSRTKIYKSVIEIDLDKVDTTKKGVNFKTRNFD